MNTQLTRIEFDRLLGEYVDAAGSAIHSEYATREERGKAMEKAIVAKLALERAVFGEELNK